ncbi:Protein of unknown function [Lactobacillus helveticus CIRM-BIA 104]|uniref:Uncharacterized protein n=1 Tax=Lactobacillus helveticus CIRM-BIA 104 TaxID=1226333 RepID=U6FD95_LACHE|nr:Protein of unknown function [Lactobacillus helveticus CIRM-BIA 104]CDI63216.1 Protein of unknown function [Lactobacillus helveticus CIRM-BIA 103]
MVGNFKPESLAG